MQRPGERVVAGAPADTGAPARTSLPDARPQLGGGQDDQGDLLTSVEIYDPATNTFTPGPDMPGAGTEPAAVFITRE